MDDAIRAAWARYQAGEAIRDIAGQFGKHPNTLRRWFQEAGLKLRPAGGCQPGWVVLGVLRLLEEEGPMTRAAICRALGADKDEVGSVISRMHKQLKNVPRRVHVADYTFKDEGSFVSYPRALYALGDKPDAKKPPRQSRKKIAKRSRAATKLRVSSVFEFAMPRRARAAHRKALRASTTVEESP